MIPNLARHTRRSTSRPLWTLLLAALLLTGPVRAAEPPAALAPAVDAVLAKVPAATQIGVYVAEVSTGQEWYAHAATTPQKPASVQKLFVTAAALDRFPADFALETAAYLHGDELWIVGGGDPGLGDERFADRAHVDRDAVFDRWAAALKSRGVTTVNKIVLDVSIFDDQVRHPDWPDNQQERWYQAPVGGLNYNDNCLDVSFNVQGRDITLDLHPDLPPELITNRLRVGDKQRAVITRRPGSNVFEVSGTAKRDGTFDPVCAGDPTVFFGYALHTALVTRGVAVPGPIVARTLRPADLATAEQIDTQRTPLADAVWRCNLFSQNMFAEALLKSLAAYDPNGQRAGEPGSWPAGTRILRETLTHLGVDLTGFEFRDGSGLSHDNRVTARGVVDLLRRMHTHPRAEVFRNSLSQPGEPGSLRTRYFDERLRGRLYGKTGTLDGVRCLAGYLQRPDGVELAFAVLIQGSAPPDTPRDVALALLAGD